MIRYGESLGLGLLVACTALCVQVFVSVFTEIFLQHDFTLDASIAHGTAYVCIFFLLCATIEELLRYTVIKKRIATYTSDTLTAIISHGALVGCGFWVFEALLVYAKNTPPTDTLSSAPLALLIHVTTSIILLAVVKKYTFSTEILAIGIVITVHAVGNFALYLALT